MKTKTTRSRIEKMHPTKRAELLRELDKVAKAEKIARLLKNWLTTAGLDYDDIGLRQKKKAKPKLYKVCNKLGVIGLDTRYFNDFGKAYRYAKHINGEITRRDKSNPSPLKPRRLTPSQKIGGI